MYHRIIPIIIPYNNTIAFSKRVIDLPQKFYENMHNLPNEIITKVREYDACKCKYRKSSKYYRLMGDELNLDLHN